MRETGRTCAMLISQVRASQSLPGLAGIPFIYIYIIYSACTMLVCARGEGECRFSDLLTDFARQRPACVLGTRCMGHIRRPTRARAHETHINRYRVTPVPAILESWRLCTRARWTCGLCFSNIVYLSGHMLCK